MSIAAAASPVIAPEMASSAVDARVAVSARSVLDGALDPVTHARGENLLQQRTLFDPSAERDSLLEDLVHARELLPAALWESISGHVRALWGSNLREGSYELSVAGWADGLATATRTAEVRGRAAGVKTLAEELRAPLAVLADVDDEVIEAVRTIDAMLAGSPSERLLSASMVNQLRARHTRTLRRLIGQDDAEASA